MQFTKQKSLIYLQLFLFVAIATFNSHSVFAQEFNGIVEVEEPIEVGTSYKERRGQHGFLVGVSYKSYYPSNYLSMYDGLEIQEFFGSEPIRAPELMLSYKYNFSLGAIGLGLHYSSASDESDYEGNSRYLAFTAVEGNANFYLDNIFNEPYVVPYIGVGLQQLEIKEQSADFDMKTASTGLALTYRFGLQFQMNWMDRRTAEEGYRDLGLENTYIDVYAVSYSSGGNVAENPSDPLDTEKPDLSSDMQLGVGLKLEF